MVGTLSTYRRMVKARSVMRVRIMASQRVVDKRCKPSFLAQAPTGGNAPVRVCAWAHYCLFVFAQLFEMCFTVSTVRVCCEGLGCASVDVLAFGFVAPLEAPVPEAVPVI